MAALTVHEMNEIAQAVMARQERFKDEALNMSIMVVLANIGDRFAPVSCVAGEWSGHKKDLQPSTGIPKCPNGHVLMQGVGKVLGWVDES
jgi:hypothetical protein